ncbi:hypothetical protein GCM10011514_30180 [Emticicia aquatilis]|uniref:Uncharacterized protein n=1 Tax=Emticicia aquatilis TaxID=1537369 RepID=A0A917DRI9_9BACT|nr:hypothetical protein [Emticicia aquatilis]GGD64193.1 hypothetical protein GCM10011514_30180 [Emticicia aquatilis]
MIVKPHETVETWELYCATFHDFKDPVGYLSGIEHTTDEVHMILSKSKTFKELKQNLHTYIEERNEFSEQAKVMLKEGHFKNHPSYIETYQSDIDAHQHDEDSLIRKLNYGL